MQDVSDHRMTAAAIIVAAGRGQRMARELPKQYLPLGGEAILRHTVEAFLVSNAISHVLVTIHPDDRPLYDSAVEGLLDTRLMPPISGGASRAASVRCGLEALHSVDPELVLIHDAARPFCAPQLISAVLEPLSEADGAFAALPVVDALWQAQDGYAAAPIPRDDVWRAQTPQAFRYAAILDAHRTVQQDAADDVEIARLAGMRVRVVEGREENFKITRPEDLARAERMLAEARGLGRRAESESA